MRPYLFILIVFLPLQQCICFVCVHFWEGNMFELEFVFFEYVCKKLNHLFLFDEDIKIYIYNLIYSRRHPTYTIKCINK